MSPRAEARGHPSTLLLFQVFVVTGLFVLLYGPIFGYLIDTWRGRDDYSHGFLVPFIALYFAWLKRDRLRQLQPLPSLVLGLPLTMLAALMLLLGRVGAIIILQDLSLVLMIAALVSLLLGIAHLKLLAFPIAYLILMIPLFGAEGEGFHWPFQLLAAHIGVLLLQSLGFAALQEAQYIHLPRISLEVVEACSGIRYLISVIAIGIPLALLTQRTLARRLALVMLAVTGAILANGLRVALIGFWTYYDQEFLHGPFHIFQGVFVSWIGFLVLFAAAWRLRQEPHARPPAATFEPPRGDASDSTARLQ